MGGEASEIGVKAACSARSAGSSSRPEMMEILFPGQPWPWWRWEDALDAARRYANPVEPRTRPLKWRALDYESGAQGQFVGQNAAFPASGKQGVSQGMENPPENPLFAQLVFDSPKLSVPPAAKRYQVHVRPR
jgi:hypothetical protein